MLLYRMARLPCKALVMDIGATVFFTIMANGISGRKLFISNSASQARQGRSQYNMLPLGMADG